MLRQELFGVDEVRCLEFAQCFSHLRKIVEGRYVLRIYLPTNQYIISESIYFELHNLKSSITQRIQYAHARSVDVSNLSQFRVVQYE